MCNGHTKTGQKDGRGLVYQYCSDDDSSYEIHGDLQNLDQTLQRMALVLVRSPVEVKEAEHQGIAYAHRYNDYKDDVCLVQEKYCPAVTLEYHIGQEVEYDSRYQQKNVMPQSPLYYDRIPF